MRVYHSVLLGLRYVCVCICLLLFSHSADRDICLYISIYVMMTRVWGNSVFCNYELIFI